MEIPRDSILGDSIKKDFFDTYLSFKFELLKHWKRRRLLIVAALAVGLPLLFYAYTPDDAYMFAANALDVVWVSILLHWCLPYLRLRSITSP